LTFQARTFGGINAITNTITVSVSTNEGSSWTVLGTRTPLSTTLTSMTPFDLSAYNGQQIAIKFETLAAGGGRGAGISQVRLNSLVYEVIPDFVPGYSNRTVAATSEIVSSLAPAQTYHFRVRAANEGGISANSATAWPVWRRNWAAAARNALCRSAPLRHHHRQRRNRRASRNRAQNPHRNHRARPRRRHRRAQPRHRAPLKGHWNAPPMWSPAIPRCRAAGAALPKRGIIWGQRRGV
jgi:hypothetical protein